AARAEGKASELESFLALVQEQKKGLEAEVAAAKSSVTGSASELDQAVAGRKQAEELLIKMRARYAELELQLQTELPALKEQLAEAHQDNQLMDAERERLAAQVERLETTRTQGADSEKELRNRIDMLQRRVNAQDAELNALRRRTGVLSSPAETQRVPAPAPSAPKPAASPPVIQGEPIEEPPTLKGRPPPGTTIGRIPLAKSGVHTAVTPVMTPKIKEPPKPAAKTEDDVELEVFELDVDENGNGDDELLLLDEEAEPTQGGNGNGGKK